MSVIFGLFTLPFLTSDALTGRRLRPFPIARVYSEKFFRRLETYIEVPPTTGMTDMIVKILVEVLSILAITTKEIKQSRASEFTRACGGTSGQRKLTIV